jgi:hypothetical protein
VDLDILVSTVLNNFSKPWGSFVRGIVAREVMPNWERLCDDFVQEELICNSGSSGQQRISEGDEDLALWTSARRRPTRVLDRVPREGPNHNKVAVGKRET